MSKVGTASSLQADRHTRFVIEGFHFAGKNRYAPVNRYSDGGAGHRSHRSQRVGGKGK